MAKKTNCVINGKEYYRTYRKVGMKLNSEGVWVDNRKAFYGTCKADAERQYQEYIKNISNSHEQSVCLGKLIDEWINTFFINSSLANGTKNLYISSYKRHFRNTSLAGRPIAEVKAKDLQSFYNDSSISFSTLKALNNLLKRFYKYAEVNDIARNITTSVAVVRKENAKKYIPANNTSNIEIWNEADLKQFIEALNGTTLKFLVVLAVNSGARISELLALTYNDIQNGFLHINKQLTEQSLNGSGIPEVTTPKSSASNRTIPLSASVVAEFEQHKILHRAEMLEKGYRTILLFTTSTGNYYYRRNVTRSLERTCKRIGVPYHKFHAFRGTFATNLSRAGIPIETTQKLLGHANINITSKYYISVDADKRREAVEKIASFSI